MAYVYTHTRLDKNEIFYIGIGSDNDNYKRSKSKDERNRHWKHVVKNTDYKIDILFDNLTWEQACEKEIQLIKEHGRRDLGTGSLVNMTDGGEGLNNPSEELRQKYRDLYTGKKLSENHKKKVIEALESVRGMSGFKKGDIPWNKGKPRDEETKRKISEKLKGIPLSEEHKINMSKVRKGKKRKPFSKETRKKMSESRKGRIPWNKGIPWSDEIKKKISDSKKS